MQCTFGNFLAIVPVMDEEELQNSHPANSPEEPTPRAEPQVVVQRPPEVGDLAHPFSQLIPNTYVTYTLVVIIGIIFLVQLGEQSTGPYPFDVQWPSCYDGTRISHDWAGCGAAVIYGQQFFRMFTLMFLHGSTTHIAFNAIALYSLGRDMERIYGRGRFLYIYFVGGFMGSLLSLAFRGPAEFTVGASGAIFAIAGMNLAFYYMYRQRLGEMGEQQYQSMLRMVGINLVIGILLIRVNNYAHIGGLLGGALLGYLFIPWHTVQQLTPKVLTADENSLATKSGLAISIVFILTALTIAVWAIWRFVLSPI